MTRRYRKHRGNIIVWRFLLAYLLVLILVLNVLPALLVGGWWRWEEEELKSEIYEEAEKLKTVPPVEQFEMELDIYFEEVDEIASMELEEYIMGVIAGEMPVSFHPQALKAQAIAARTYALNKMSDDNRGCKYHEEADVCTDFNCCQEFENIESAISKWPESERKKNFERIKDAVQSTSGLVLTYDDSLIQSVYHSTCGGRTENGSAVWSSSNNHPYLVSVECDYCRHSDHFKKETAVDFSHYAAAFNNEQGVVMLSEDNTPDLEVAKRSESGRNKVVKLEGETYSGLEAREILDLPSTNFSWRIEGTQLIFETSGFGHGVGLCQYGADGMAQEGNDFEEILSYYYRGAEITRLQE